MSKLKLDERVENAVNAFFEVEPDRSDFALAYVGETALAADDATFGEKADKWLGVLRQIFLFAPGTFFLFYMTLTLIFFYPEIGISFQGILMLLAPAFMTYAGCGRLKDTRNWVVPAAIVSVAVFVAAVSALFPPSAKPNLYFWYSIYLFPNALIAAKIAQAIVQPKPKTDR